LHPPAAENHAALGQALEGQRQQRIPGQDRISGAKDRPGGRAVPPHQVAIHDIVLKQREVVHKLDGNRDRDGCLRVAAHRLRAQQRESGADRLAHVPGGRPPVDVTPAEVVAGDPAHRLRQLRHGLPHPGIGSCPAPGQGVPGRPACTEPVSHVGAAFVYHGG
jgi:hypothetical protein